MSNGCDSGGASTQAAADKRFRRILWIALLSNAAMFGVELVAGVRADSTALLADAVDFMGDAANYALSLFVLALAPVWRSHTALAKGVTMGVYGVFVLGAVLWNASRGIVPEAATMGVVGLLALLVNVSVAVLLFAYRRGDANMRSVWLCSRNDALGNIAVMLAALGVAGTGSSWPDAVVALAMGLLGLTAAREVIRVAWREMRA